MGGGKERNEQVMFRYLVVPASPGFSGGGRIHGRTADEELAGTWDR